MYNCLGLHECDGYSSANNVRKCGYCGISIWDFGDSQFCMNVVDVPLILVYMSVVNVVLLSRIT